MLLFFVFLMKYISYRKIVRINDYFRRQSIMTLTDLELFEYILDERHIIDGDHTKLVLCVEN